MTLRDAIARANAALDWIEQRDGPLKPDGYARVEATVAEVRAWGQAMSDDDARISEIRARLEKATPGPWQTWPEGTEESVESVSLGRFVCHLNSNMRQFREDAALIANAPADIAYLLARADALTAERDEWKRINQSDNQCAARRLEQAESERDALAARLAASEAALERAEAAQKWADALDAWTVNALYIAADRRIPSADMIADGEEILTGLRAALAASSAEVEG